MEISVMTKTFKKLFERIADRLRPSELQLLDTGQVDEIARDIGVTSDDLRRLDRMDEHSAMLMPQRLRHEGIDPAVIEAKWPSVWKDLQRVCGNCNSKDVCQAELEIAPDARDWRRYCSNAGTIRSLENRP
jgi:hypothetical protein